MTLIAAITVGNVPVLIGDILVTRDRLSDEDVSTPLVHKASSHLYGASISGICQKVVVLHKHLCVAWSGTLFHAARLLRELEQAVRDDENISLSIISAVCSEWNKFDQEELSFIVYWVDGEQLSLASNFAPWPLDNIPDLRVTGSGIPHFVAHAERAFAYDVYGAECPYNIAVNHAFSYIAQAAMDEIERAEGIAERWGGGFEVAVLWQNGFSKVDKVLWTSWAIIQRPYGLVLCLRRPYMFQYYRDGQAHFFVDEDPKDEGPRHYVAVSPAHFNQEAVYDRLPIDPEVVVCLIADGTFRRTFVSINAEGSEPEARIVRAEGLLFPQFSAQFLSRLIAGIENAGGKKVVLVDIWGDVRRWP